MKRSSAVILAILILLAGISIYVYKSKSRLSTGDEDARSFAYKDTAAITKIFIADKEGDQSTLERTKNGWVVNGKYKCRSEAILNLLEVIKRVEVKMPVGQKIRNSVIKVMASSAMKVEVYAGDELVKQYFVGHETADSEGSYMLLTNLSSGKNYEEPYVCFIPGFVGFLKPRYIAKENEWRDRVAINYIPPQLKQVRVDHYDMAPDSSFTIDVLNTTTFKLKDVHNNELPFDVNKMKQYLAYFQNISYELLVTGMDKPLQDSLSKTKPFLVISVTSTDFKTSDYKFYRKPFAGNINPEHGVVYHFDPDRLYMRFAGDREWALIQYFVFGKLFATRDYFLPAKSVKK